MAEPATIPANAVQVVAETNPLTLLASAVAQGAGIETLKELMALHERWEASQARKAFDAAMADAKALMPVIAKNRTVDFTGKTGVRTNYQFEDLAEIARSIDPILSRFGLSYRFRTTSAANEPVSVTCIVSHRLGHSEENTLHAGRDDSGNKNPIQSVGSTITFLQRYTLKAALGLSASVDDDGAASGKPAGDGLISEDQVFELQALITEVGAPLDKVLAYAKVEALSDIPARNFDKVRSAILAKRKPAA